MQKLSKLNLSHDTHGILGMVTWIIALSAYFMFVINPLDDNAEYVLLKNDPNLLKSYFFEALPVVFLAVYLYYWDRKKYQSAYLSSLSPIIVPFTAWGFHGMTEMMALAIYKLVI